MRTQDRFVVVHSGQHNKDGSCKRRTYTEFLDAATVAKRAGRNRGGKPVFLMHGSIGMEKLIGKCAKNRCTKQISASDQANLMSCRVGVSKKQARKAVIAARAKARGLSGARRHKRRR
jgi:hypothetical protein